MLFFVFAKPIAGLYISGEGELLDMTVFAVRMIALQAPLNGFVRSRITYLQSVDRTRNMQMLTALSTVVYVVLSAFVLGEVFGAYGVPAMPFRPPDFFTGALSYLFLAYHA